MHDTFLLKRISENLSELCMANSITRVDRLKILTSQTSHIDPTDLCEHLAELHSGLVGEWTRITVEKSRDIEELTAIIESIEGDTLE